MFYRRASLFQPAHLLGLTLALIGVVGWLVLPGHFWRSYFANTASYSEAITAPALHTPTPVPEKEFYVSPSGKPDWDGSINRPWDLATALAHPPEVKPGAVIWLRGGTYTGVYTSRLKGTAQAPITVRQYANERAVIDSAGLTGSPLTVRGEWAVYWGFELMNSDPRRITDRSGSRAVKEWRADGLVALGPHTKFINLVIHDNADGIGFWSAAQDAEVYGCIIYNNGWLGPDRGHGHGIYAQNETGLKRIVDCISFNNFGRGIEAYGTNAYTVGFHFEGNASFNNYSLAARGDAKRHPNLFVGTIKTPSDQITITDNYLYHPSNTYPDFGGNLALGFRSLSNKNVVVKNNYVAGGSRAFGISQWETATVTGNTFYAAVAGGKSPPGRLVEVHLPEGGKAAAYAWDNNVYFDGTKPSPAGQTTPFFFNIGARRRYAEWKEATGFDRASRYTVGRPTGTRVFIRPNRYEAGRAHIVVYNWDLKNTIEVDVGKILPLGAAYEVRNVQDYFGPPVLTGTHNGKPLRLPMTNLKVAPALGYDFTPAATGPEFNVFVLLSTKPSPR